ncbi:Hyaluronan synthase [Corynebacterium heidelbergense]|uniref:glycosyltransferase n=1 Tax=Corynebacterium heidelbergense TaxID=2055947 RepID=UPI0023598405|nr:glycosyltransferase [Corynebacterium heidelbergense]WCZ36647.1 Hyaluronan synthase [Corynebacterium heidelbergense]
MAHEHRPEAHQHRPEAHIIIGPDEHGVVEYALGLHAHCPGALVREPDPARIADVRRRLAEFRRVHVTFTDHLFGPSPSQAVDNLLALVEGKKLSVSFHDVPQPAEGEQRYARRRAAYGRLVQRADVVVTNSRAEAAELAAAAADYGGWGEPARWRAKIGVVHLPLPQPGNANATDLQQQKQQPQQQQPHQQRPTHPEGTPAVLGILGFVYPGKGHEDVISALASLPQPRPVLRNLGGVSAGHEQFADSLHDLAGQGRVDYEHTGYLAQEELTRQMARVDIPVCAHRHVSASGSLMQWLAAGRRVLVAHSPYAREIAEDFGEQVVLVEPGEWSSAMAAAIKDPRFAARYEPRPWGWPEVANAVEARWAQQWGSATELALNPPAERVTGDGPTRRDASARSQPSVAVVMPYYQDPAGLDAVLGALGKQDYCGPLRVVLADDGSPDPLDPTVLQAQWDLPITCVRQEDRGFRAAAARNLGARAADAADILLFLDGDTVPESRYVSAMVEALDEDPRAVVVGARAHDVPGQAQPSVPEWLAEGWRSTVNLREAGETSFRFLISATWGMWRNFFDECGGFDATLIGYGGEDWELAWQAWQRGGVLRHQPLARAVHRGADWAGRSEGALDRACVEKNAETVALAHRIAHPEFRPPGVLFDVPEIVFHLGPLDPGMRPGHLALGIQRLLQCADCTIHINPADAPDPRRSAPHPPWWAAELASVRELYAADPRVQWHSDPTGSSAETGARLRGQSRFSVDIVDLNRFLAALRARARAEQTDEGTSLATALTHVARRGGRAQWWVSTPQTGEEKRERVLVLVAEVVSTRRRAWERLERAGRRVTLPGPVGLFSDLPDEDLGEGDLAETAAPLRLEALFGKWH